MDRTSKNNSLGVNTRKKNSLAKNNFDPVKEFQDNLYSKEKELEEKEKFLELFAIQLNEKEEELSTKENAIQKFLKEEIESSIDETKISSKQKRGPLIKKIVEEILLFQVQENEENEIKERKFLRNEYKKLKQSLFHEMNNIHFDSEEDEEEFEIDEFDIERIKQELKDELEYLEKRHPASNTNNGVRLTKQDLVDLRTFDSSNTNEEVNVLQNYVELYNKAKLKFEKFVFLTFITGTEKR